ncbi:hypothetical protein [Mycoplasmoides pneumoniae]|uniref:Uncharacterized protein n=1 Tax=Mycoplasmoides pneumoniae TaxID=2104 RepID=A0AB38W7G3_MYCPM|nr:Uncharacterised protein [Mycoplasmoides pneumoniae]
MRLEVFPKDEITKKLLDNGSIGKLVDKIYFDYKVNLLLYLVYSVL